MSKKLNLVFQGGGVRGIAFATALENMPSTVEIYAVGGTSAGAIVAALLAIGKRPSELASLLDRARFASFLSDEDRERAARLNDSIQRIKRACIEISGSNGSPSIFEVLKLAMHLRKHFATDLNVVCRARGLYATTSLRNWLEELFGDKKFGDIKTYDLRIVAADINERRYRTFSRTRHKYGEVASETTIADAVHQSISIPLFFHPHKNGNKYVVDGGVLSNFPAYLFAQLPYPTVGFRLRDIELPREDSVLGFLGGLLATMTEAHDKQRELPDDYHAFDIPVPQVPSFKFDLTNEDQKVLELQGRSIGALVRWGDLGSSAPAPSTFDSRPQRALNESMVQAARLFDITDAKSQWPEEIVQDTTYSIWLHADWSTEYDITTQYRIRGKSPISIFRTKIVDLPSDREARLTSILDCDFEHFEVIEGAKIPLVKIPCGNLENEKHFLTFCWPPLSEETSPRTLIMRWSVKKEFADKLGAASPGVRTRGDISYSTKQRAHKHRLNLNIELYVHASLPIDLGIPVHVGNREVAKSAPIHKTSGPYNPYSWRNISRDVVIKEKLELLLTRS